MLDRPGIFQSPILSQARQRKVRTDFHSAPGFRWLGSYYSCIPDPELPINPRVVEAIQRRDPGFIPMIVYSVYLSCADYASERRYVVKRHAAGRYIARPKAPKHRFYCLMPKGATHPPPNQIDEIFHEGPRDPQGPFVRGGFHALSWDLAWEPMVQLTRAQLRKLHVEDPDERERRRAESEAEESSWRQRDLERYFEKKLGTMSDLEIENFVKRQQAGLPVVERDKPIRVFHGAAAGAAGHAH